MDYPFILTLGELRQKANAVRVENRGKRREKIVELSRGFAVTNAVIQSYFRVSRQTASKDLAVLVKNGSLSRLGRGRSTAYTLTV
ncbi:hypothetical protein HY950_01510 [Candidatus Gottesmanbacteria bacterium]|nr:hypothetical protein [Candidatus Gottesmanbacteria bacterium]